MLISEYLADDFHPAPTFTPPELPKRVHVRGSVTGNKKFYNTYTMTHSSRIHTQNTFPSITVEETALSAHSFL